MRLEAIAVAAGLALAALTGGAAFSVEEDFSVSDPRGGAYGIDIERHSTLSHRHGWIEDGAYLIPVEGNRHFVAAPTLGDFTLKADLDMTLFRLNMTLGYVVYFRWDRAAGRGHRLEVAWDRDRKLRFTLDGREIFSRQDADPLPLSGQSLVLSVSGRRGRIETLGAAVDFEVASDAAAKGSVGFDLPLNESEKLRIRRVTLESPESPVAEPAGRWRFALDQTQGFEAPAVYDVSFDRYADGVTRVTCRLSGMLPGRGERKESGGKEWSSAIERLESPYVKLTGADGVSRTLFLWNGMRAFRDPQLLKRRGRPLQKWPVERVYYLREMPDDFTLAAGYVGAMVNPWRFVGNGPYEQVRAKDGSFVFEGEAIGPGRVSFAAASPADKKIVSQIPADLPQRERAVEHARREHYFRASEEVRFALSAVWRASDYESGEIALVPRVESVYREPTGITCEIVSNAVEDLPAGLRRRVVVCRMAWNPGVGVWHLETAVRAGAGASRDERTVFEVLSDDPDGPCPPLASGLPVFVSMPNEIKFLEESAFDPWGRLGGAAHYYAIDMRYPQTGVDLHVWDADHLYRRKWFTTVMDRNTGDIDSKSDRNRLIIRKADYLGLYVPGKHREGRFDLTFPHFYKDRQFQILKEYLAERRPALKLLTPERLAEREKENKGISSEEFEEFFNLCWNDFKAYAARRIAAYTQSFVDYLMKENPRTARASYGPMPVYTAVYKSPYVLEFNSHPVETDPRIRANGSFWLFEDYHYSCDYPMSRPAYFVAAYCLLYPGARRIFPEIYYQGWGRCEDGAVYQAHPSGYGAKLAFTHQRRVAYQFAYGTPYFRDGSFGFWTDYGFHARNPEKEAMDEFVYAWGKLRANPPAAPLRSPYTVVDPDAFRRYGDTFEPGAAYKLVGPGFSDVRPDVVNVAEADVGWAHERCCAFGYATPVVTRLSDLARVDPASAEFVILPPLVEGAPAEALKAIRSLHERGVGLLCFESAVGLEDLFGAAQAAPGAVLVTNQTACGRTAFFPKAPVLEGRSDFFSRYSRGRDTLSKRVDAALADAFAFLAPRPAVRTERGNVFANRTKDGAIAVVLSEASPLYGDTDEYPATFRFTVEAPGIGGRMVEADAEYSVVSASRDRVTLRTRTDKDTALFFRFAEKPNRKCPESIDWSAAREFAPGMKYVHVTLDEPRLMENYMVRVDMRTPGLRVTGTGRAANWGETMPDVTNRVMVIDTLRKQTRTFLEEHRRNGTNMVLAVNTAPWGPWEPPWTHKYARLPHLAVLNGEVVSHTDKRGPMLVVFTNNVAVVTNALDDADIKSVAVAHPGFGIIMRGGEILAKRRPGRPPSLAPRTAFGISPDKRYLYVLVVDGRQMGYSHGADMADLAELLKAAGASDAINVDGGGSSTLVYRDGGNTVSANRHDPNRRHYRYVSMNLGFWFSDGK
ncbi:MAG: phosphodiester glycosidase family protein [Kiritimatiellae bacterium]|nr:phosphodiester glycosidase family protein [Kiritimatiellia bacterium]